MAIKVKEGLTWFKYDTSRNWELERIDWETDDYEMGILFIKEIPETRFKRGDVIVVQQEGKVGTKTCMVEREYAHSRYPTDCLKIVAFS